MADAKKSDMPFDPAGIVEKAFLLGIGVLEVTKDKTTELAHDLIAKGEMSQSDAKKVADRINEIAADQQETMRKTVASETDKALKTSGVATKAEMDDLKAQIAELKSMVASMSPSDKGAKPPTTDVE